MIDPVFLAALLILSAAARAYLSAPIKALVSAIEFYPAHRGDL